MVSNNMSIYIMRITNYNAKDIFLVVPDDPYGFVWVDVNTDGGLRSFYDEYKKLEEWLQIRNIEYQLKNVYINISKLFEDS